MAFALQNLGLIGRGAQGSVWLVFDRDQGRFLALKVVACASWDEADARLTRLRPLVTGQPNPWHSSPLELGRGDQAPEGVRRAFPTEVSGPSFYILMLHVHGPSAAELARGDPSFGWAEALALGAQVAQKLARRPEGAAHLDLKPENVLIDRKSGEAFLVDAHCGSTAGTPAYAAPEQAASPSPAADLFAFGRMLRRLAARDVGPDVHAAILPAWPEIPADWPPPKRGLVKDFIDFVDRALCQSGAPSRPLASEAAKHLLEGAAAFNGPDLPAVLVQSMDRATLPRVEAEREQLAKENPLPQRGRGQGEGASRFPLWAAVLGSSFTAAILAFGLWHRDYRHASVMDDLPPAPPPVAATAPAPPPPPSAPSAAPPKSCALGEILAPEIVRFLCPGEKPRPGHGALPIVVEGASHGGTTLSFVDSPNQTLWKVTSPPAGAGGRLELPAPHYYASLSPSKEGLFPSRHYLDGKDPSKLTPEELKKRRVPTLFINGEADFAPSLPPPDWKALRATDPRRFQALTRTVTEPTPLTQSPATLLRLTLKGAGAVTWNVTEHPCTPPRTPLDPKYISPEIPFEIPEDATVWACPTRGHGLEIEGEVYQPP